MSAIYLHPVDGFTFLENVPEKPEDHPNFKSGMDQYSEPLETNGFWQKKLQDYNRALAEAIQNRLVIGNPEEFAYKYEAGKHSQWAKVEDAYSQKRVIQWLKEGELYPWQGTWEITFGCDKCGAHYSPEPIQCENGYCEKRKVVILSPQKEEKTPGYAGMDFHPNDVEGDWTNSKINDPLWKIVSNAFHSYTHEGAIKFLIGQGFKITKPEPVVSQDQEEQDKIWKDFFEYLYSRCDMTNDTYSTDSIITFIKRESDFTISRKPID